MSTINPLDPYGGSTPNIEQQLGNAYDVVRFVASNMDKIQEVNENMEEIKDAAHLKDDVTELVQEAEVAKNAAEAAASATSQDAITTAQNAAATSADATSATASKNAAATSATSAASSTTAAAASALEAKAARDAAVINGTLYATEADGRAAVTDNAYFRVVGSGEIAARLYQRISAAVSNFIVDIPSSDGVDSVQRRTTFTDAMHLVDLAVAAKQITGVYVNAADNAIRNLASQQAVFIPIIPGHVYRVTAIQTTGAIATENGLIGALTSDATSGARPSLGRATWAMGDTPTSWKVTIPVGMSTAKYLVMNTLLTGSNFDVRTNLSVIDITESYLEIGKTDGKKLGALYQDQLKSAATNLASEATFLDGFYVYLNQGTPANVGKLMPAAGTGSYLFPVVEGKTYRITASSYSAAALGVCFKADTNTRVTDTIASPATLVVSGSSREFTVPTGLGIKYAAMSVLLPGLSFDIRAGLQIYVTNDTVTHIAGKALTSPVYERESALQFPAKAKGKLWVGIGDSITQKNFRANKNYHDFIREAYEGISFENRGQGGTGYYSRYNVANDITSTPDLITVFLGTNDWGTMAGRAVPLGQFGDTTSSTIAGCIYLLLSQLINKFPTVPIGVITPLPRSDSWGDNGGKNPQNYSLHELSQLILRYANHFSLPSLDLYSESGLPVYTEQGNIAFFTPTDGSPADGLHPNDAGQAVMARKITQLLRKM